MKEVFSIGTVMALISVLFLWIIAGIFIRIGKTRKFVALGVGFLSAIPFLFVINAVLSKMISEPLADVWDMLTVFLLLLSAFVSFICDYAGRIRRNSSL